MSRRTTTTTTTAPQFTSESMTASASRRARIIKGASTSCVSLSKDETLLVSSSGDVVSCRCRSSQYINGSEGGKSWQDEFAVLCCEADCDDLSTQLQDSAFCGKWSSNARPRVGAKRRPGGLLGGAPPVAEDASPMHHHHHPAGGLRGGGGLFREHTSQRNSDPNLPMMVSSTNSPKDKARQAFRSQPLRPLDTDREFDDDGSIVPIRSFDYSHFADGGNDMLPESPFFDVSSLEQRQNPSPLSANTKRIYNDEQHLVIDGPQFFHGVPTFLHSFQQIKVNQVSAHPLGSHVLITSSEGLLFSYGLNDYGQLGIGVRTHVSCFHRGYIMTPTIVTPLVENGGKTIACAAGVNHSLVVVMTEERRLVKSRSFEPPTNNTQIPGGGGGGRGGRITTPPATESVVYHQIYGFGRNDSMKIGLVSPKLAQFSGPEAEMEAVVLPRRVALRCKVRPADNNDSTLMMPPQGIFSIQASEEHSAALVRRASGDVELYTWGNATYGALGLPHPTTSTMVLQNITQQRNKVNTENSSPTSNDRQVNVAPVPSFVSTLSRTTANREALASSMLIAEEKEYPTRISLGRRCSFVLTSLGRCFSFGTSERGMLGLGPKITESQRPSEIALPVDFRNEKLVCVSAGASHVLANTESGRVLAWGSYHPIGKQPPPRPGSAVQSSTSSLQQADSLTSLNKATTTDESLVVDWSPRPVELERTWNANTRRSSTMSGQRPPSPSGVDSSHDDSSEPPPKIAEVCAGYDCSVLVTESGRVLSCGKNSGRLGLGDCSESIVHSPRPMFGGLRLWQEHDRRKADPVPGRRKITRGNTVS